MSYKVINLRAKDGYLKSLGLSKQKVFDELLKIEKQVNGLDGGDLEEKVDNLKTTTLFSVDENNKIIGHVIYTTRKKFIEIDRISVINKDDFRNTVFDLLDSILEREAFKQLKWIRIWVKQDFDNVDLCYALVDYGFISFPDENDMTRFAFREPKKK